MSCLCTTVARNSYPCFVDNITFQLGQKFLRSAIPNTLTKKRLSTFSHRNLPNAIHVLPPACDEWYMETLTNGVSIHLCDAYDLTFLAFGVIVVIHCYLIVSTSFRFISNLILESRYRSFKRATQRLHPLPSHLYPYLQFHLHSPFSIFARTTDLVFRSLQATPLFTIHGQRLPFPFDINVYRADYIFFLLPGTGERRSSM